MEADEKPDLGTFLEQIRVAVPQFMLSRIGSVRHEIGFVTDAREPFRVPTAFDIRRQYLIERGLDYRLFWRSISFGEIGMVCSSNTRPSVREATLHAQIPNDCPVEFQVEPGGPLDEPTERVVTGRSFRDRVDFTRPEEPDGESARLLLLEPGYVYYALRPFGARLRHPEFCVKYEALMRNEDDTFLSDSDREKLEEAYLDVAARVEVDLILVLDSAELLAFHWSHTQGRFLDDFYNVGVTRR